MASRAQRNDQIYEAVKGWRHWVGNDMLDQLGIPNVDGTRDERFRKRLTMAEAGAIECMLEFFELEEGPKVDEIWPTPGVKLFISHVSEAKVRAKELTELLKPFGIVSFLAHDAIKPLRTWRNILREGLDSMDALLSFHSEGFNASEWCSQEVGWASGRGIPVIPVMENEEPAGFLADTQAIKWNAGATPSAKKQVAEAIFNALAAHEATRQLLAETLARDLKFVGSYAGADFVISKLEETGPLSEHARRNIELANLLNDQVRDKAEGLLAQEAAEVEMA